MDIVYKLSNLRLSDGTSAGERIFSGGHASNSDNVVDNKGNNYDNSTRKRKESNMMDDKITHTSTYNSENKNVHMQARRNKRKTGGSTIYNKNKNNSISPVYNVVNRNRASPPSLLLPQTTKESANEQFARYNKNVNESNASPQSQLFMYTNSNSTNNNNNNNKNYNTVADNNAQRQKLEEHLQEQQEQLRQRRQQQEKESEQEQKIQEHNYQQEQWLKKYTLPSYQDSQTAAHTSEQPRMHLQGNMPKSNANTMRYDKHEMPRTADLIKANTQSWNNKNMPQKESSKYNTIAKNKETNASHGKILQGDKIVREARPRSAATVDLAKIVNNNANNYNYKLPFKSNSMNNENNNNTEATTINNSKVEIDSNNANNTSETRKSLGEKAPLSTLMSSQSPTSLKDLAQRLNSNYADNNTNMWYGHSNNTLPNVHTSPSLSSSATTNNNNISPVPPPAHSTLASSLLSQLNTTLSEHNVLMSQQVENNKTEFTKLSTENKLMNELDIIGGSNSQNSNGDAKGTSVQSVSDLLAKTANSFHWEISASGTNSGNVAMLQTQNEFTNKTIDVKSVEANSHYSSFIEQQMLNARREDQNNITAKINESLLQEEQKQQKEEQEKKERDVNNQFIENVQNNVKVGNVFTSSSDTNNSNNNRYSNQEVESILTKMQINNSNTETTNNIKNKSDVNKVKGTSTYEENNDNNHHHQHHEHNHNDTRTKTTEVTEKHTTHHNKNEKHIQVQYMPHSGYNDSSNLMNAIVEEAMSVNAFLELNFEESDEYVNSNSAKFSEVSDNYNANSPIIRTLKRLPDNGRNIIIGDVHGCVEQLEHLIEKVKYVDGCDRLIVIGDYVNKGPDSVGVIRLCQRHHAIGILGNHDFTLINCIARNRRRAYTPEELRDPVKKLAKDFPLDCEYYLRRLPHIIRIPECNLILVHAGLNPQHTLTQQSVMEIMHLRRLEEVNVTSQMTSNSLATATVTTVNNNDVSSKTITATAINSSANSNNQNTNTNNSSSNKHYRAITKGTAGVPWATVWNGPEHVIFGHDAASGFQAHRFAYGIDTGCVYGDPLTCVIYSAQSTSGTFCSVPGLPRHSNELMGLPPPRADIYEQLQLNLEKSIIRPTTATTPITAFRSAASAFVAFPPNYTHDGGNLRSGSSACSPISRLTNSMCATIPVPATVSTNAKVEAPPPQQQQQEQQQQEHDQKSTKELTSTKNTKEGQKLLLPSSTSSSSSASASATAGVQHSRFLASHQPLPESQRAKRHDSPFSPASSQNGSLMASPVMRFVNAPNDTTSAVEAAAVIGTREVQKATLLALSTAHEITALLLVLSMPVYELEFDNMMSEDANDHTAQEAFWLPFARGIIDAALSVSTEKEDKKDSNSKVTNGNNYDTRQKHHDKQSQEDNDDTVSDVIEKIEELLHVALSVCESMNEVKDKLHKELNNLISDAHVHKWSRGIRKYISVVL